MDEQKNIRVIFTDKADISLSAIMAKYNLEENEEQKFKKIQKKRPSNMVTLVRLIKDFTKGATSEKNLVDSLQKDLDITQQTAEKISKEIIADIIPLLEKAPEEKFEDPSFREEISKKIFGEQPAQTKSTPQKIDIGDKNLFPDIQPQKNTPEQKTPVFSSQPKTKKSIPVIKNDLPTKQPKGPDKYREPIQ